MYVCMYIVPALCVSIERKRSEPRTPAVGDQMLSVAA